MNPGILVLARWVALSGAAVTGVVCGLVLGWDFGLGVAAAGLWSVASLRTLEGLLGAAVVTVGEKRDRRTIFFWSMAKLGIYVVAVWVLLVGPFPALSLLVGLTWLVLGLVIAGIFAAPRQDGNATPRG